jgi:hypothetical protein
MTNQELFAKIANDTLRLPPDTAWPELLQRLREEGFDPSTATCYRYDVWDVRKRLLAGAPTAGEATAAGDVVEADEAEKAEPDKAHTAEAGKAEHEAALKRWREACTAHAARTEELEAQIKAVAEYDDQQRAQLQAILKGHLESKPVRPRMEKPEADKAIPLPDIDAMNWDALVAELLSAPGLHDAPASWLRDIVARKPINHELPMLRRFVQQKRGIAKTGASLHSEGVPGQMWGMLGIGLGAR